MTVMSQVQTAEYLNLSVSTASLLSRTGEIPSKKVGKRRRLYVKEQIDKWIQEGSARTSEA